MSTVYVGLSADFLHHGHIRLVEAAASFGELTVGLLTESAMSGHKKLPLLNFEQRKELILGLKGVKSVVAQEDWDYSINLRKYKPDYFVHGDDWRNSNLESIRRSCLDVLSEYGGEMVEVPHTPGLRIHGVENLAWQLLGTPETRGNQLRRLLYARRSSSSITRAIETHSPLSALIAQDAVVDNGTSRREFDALWSSSLTDSTLLGKPDTESVDLSVRLAGVAQILAATSKPVIFDGDTGGKLEHFGSAIQAMERIGISAVVVEDKVGLKRNSLLGTEVVQHQATIEEFCVRIKAGKSAQLTDGFMIIARIESLVLDKPISEALERSSEYLEAGADGIFLSSREKSPTQIFDFSQKFKELHNDAFLVVVPSTYPSVKENELYRNGIDLVIYANHLLRASFPAMKKTAQSILEFQRALEIEKELLTIKEILNVIPGTVD
jgi:phosphoenolpyruvate phosphomutase